jgi:hypothetical protein
MIIKGYKLTLGASRHRQQSYHPQPTTETRVMHTSLLTETCFECASKAAGMSGDSICARFVLLKLGRLKQTFVKKSNEIADS